MSKKEDKFDWMDSSNVGTVDEVNVGPMYGTPDWVRHPERYPELMDRLSKFAQEVWSEGLKEEQ